MVGKIFIPGIKNFTVILIFSVVCIVGWSVVKLVLFLLSKVHITIG